MQNGNSSFYKTNHIEFFKILSKVLDFIWEFSYIIFIVLKSTEPSEEDLQRIRDNLLDLDRNLGAYPYQNLKHWNRLTSNISGNY